MHSRILLPLAAALALAAPAAASADFPHTVTAGESLSSIAAADGLSVAGLAAANGISPDAPLITGDTVQIPAAGPAPGGTATTSAPVTAAGSGDGDADSDDPSSGVAAASSTSSSSSGYTVVPGDTLSAIAARAGISVDSLAAANGLDPNAPLLAGSVISLSGSSGSSAGPAPSAAPSAPSAPSAAGTYTVQPGDTLSALAARAGTSVASLAAANGLDPNAPLLAGSNVTLSGSGTASSSAAGQPIGAAAEGSSSGGPYPTPERVTASEVGSIASANGVSPSLAAAIGWQESGFNNDLVSSADARGVMQILPGTWDWIQQTLTAGTPLSPNSAADNVRGGVLMLHSLLDATGGDPALAAAGYYQGLASVQQNGMYSDTQQYVNSVLALRGQFGGP